MSLKDILKIKLKPHWSEKPIVRDSERCGSQNKFRLSVFRNLGYCKS